MRVAADARALHHAFDTARMEAERAFGNGDLYLEKYLDHPRHIEVQIIADGYGRTVALGERECSIQRRHQKLVEESPSTAVDEALRQQMCAAAVAAARAVGYTSAGTVEFLYQDGQFYFMEMNTRIQVEHPVTEAVTGVDIVSSNCASLPACLWACAGGELRGHAIELRISAEDPITFAPSAGTVTEARVSRRAGGADRQPPLPRLPGASELRLAHRQGHRLRAATARRRCGGRDEPWTRFSSVVSRPPSRSTGVSWRSRTSLPAVSRRTSWDRLIRPEAGT